MAKIKILGFGASLRKGGLSTAMLETAKELIPENSVLETFSLEGIPLYNQDIEGSGKMPESVKEFKKKLKEADALLITTPEYNYSVPGYLKNAIDWATRPPGDSSFDGKPVLFMGSSNGRFGGLRAVMHLRQIFSGSGFGPIIKPDVFLINGLEKIKDGRVVDEQTREQMRKQLQALVEHARLSGKTK